MNDIMKFFGQQVSAESFDQIKIIMLRLNRFVPGHTARSKSRRRLTIVHLSRSGTVCSAPASSVRLKTTNACAANTNA